MDAEKATLEGLVKRLTRVGLRRAGNPEKLTLSTRQHLKLEGFSLEISANVTCYGQKALVTLRFEKSHGVTTISDPRVKEILHNIIEAANSMIGWRVEAVSVTGVQLWLGQQNVAQKDQAEMISQWLSSP